MLWLLNPFPSAEGPVVPETKDFWFINAFGTSAFSSHTWKKWNSVTCDSFIPRDIYIALTIAFFMHFSTKMLIILKPNIPLIFLVIVIYTIQGRIDSKCLTVHLEVRDIPDDLTLVNDHATTKGRQTFISKYLKTANLKKSKAEEAYFTWQISRCIIVYCINGRITRISFFHCLWHSNK